MLFTALKWGQKEKKTHLYNTVLICTCNLCGHSLFVKDFQEYLENEVCMGKITFKNM